MLQQAQATYTSTQRLTCYPHMRLHTCSVYVQAFREGFTLTLVSGRTVGIGAYLARLGRR